MPVGRTLGVVSMTSVRLALGIAVGLAISAAAWGLAQNKDPGEESVALPPAAPAPTSRDDSAGFGSGGPSPSASLSASSTPSGTASAPPSPSLAVPPLLAPRRPVPEAARPSGRSPAAGRLTAEFSFSSTWADGFVANVDLTNSTGQEQDWEVVLTFPADVTVPDGSEWNATKTGVTGTITFTGRAVPAGGTLTFGFQAEKTAQNRKDFAPTGCTLNGVNCEKF
jgi:hypothetical protein